MIYSENSFLFDKYIYERMIKMAQLDKKVAVITGAASGIGLAIAQAIAAQGATVVMADINEEKLKEEAQLIGGDFFKTDLSKREDCKALINYTTKEHSKIDILVNVAGIQTVAPIEEFPEDKWDFMISLMLTAPFLLTRYAWPSMKKNGWGRVIHLNSIHGLVASEYKAAYVSAKHGLTGFTKVAGLEGGPYGITVNSVCPSYVRTPLVEAQIASQAKTHGIPEEEVISSIMLQKSAIKSLLDPNTVAATVLFLCSDAASHITGAAIPIDGGWTAG